MAGAVYTLYTHGNELIVLAYEGGSYSAEVLTIEGVMPTAEEIDRLLGFEGQLDYPLRLVIEQAEAAGFSVRILTAEEKLKCVVRTVMEYLTWLSADEAEGE